MPNRPSREAIQERPNLGRSVTVTLSDGSKHVGYVQRIAIHVAGLLDNTDPIEDEDPHSALLRGLESGVYYKIHGITDRLVPKQDVTFNPEMGTKAENITLRLTEEESRSILDLITYLDLRTLRDFTDEGESVFTEKLFKAMPALKVVRDALEETISAIRLGEWYKRIRKDRDERDHYDFGEYDRYEDEGEDEDDGPHI
jgi:hypothetical protein